MPLADAGTHAAQGEMLPGGGGGGSARTRLWFRDGETGTSTTRGVLQAGGEEMGMDMEPLHAGGAQPAGDGEDLQIGLAETVSREMAGMRPPAVELRGNIQIRDSIHLDAAATAADRSNSAGLIQRPLPERSGIRQPGIRSLRRRRMAMFYGTGLSPPLPENIILPALPAATYSPAATNGTVGTSNVAFLHALQANPSFRLAPGPLGRGSASGLPGEGVAGAGGDEDSLAYGGGETGEERDPRRLESAEEVAAWARSMVASGLPAGPVAAR